MSALNRGTKGKNLAVILSLILVISFGLMTINIKADKGAFFFESVFAAIVAPFQNIFAKTVDGISEIVEHYFFLVNVSKENERLRAEIDRLTKGKNDLQEQFDWSQRVFGLMKPQTSQSDKYLIATIIGRDATQWSRVVYMDKGTRDGVREKLAVVTNKGVIGHVIHSAPNSSKLLLITDSRSAVDALFQDSRVPGVVVGNGGDTCDMKYVPIDAEVKEGDKVISSGLGGIFPKGMEVGTVFKVTKRKQGLFQEITIKPGAQISRLEEVLVLLP